jgi:prevent-host-death family protein
MTLPGRPKSDNLIAMSRDISATEAARRFSDVLDAVEHDGESFVVHRRGRAVARLSPAGPSSGRAVKDALLATAPDRAWARELAELRRSAPVQERSWPG